MFKKGAKAVYPAHGVVRIKGIEVKEICGTKRAYYILNVIDSDAIVMVPTDNAESVGLRAVVDKSQIPKIYSILAGKNKSLNASNGHQSWNKRYREYAEKIKSGDVVEVAKVLRDINILRNIKELSFGERRIMDSARSLLVKEISISKSLDEEFIAGEIGKLLST
ncbi:MAG: CarD family transcriptional regulator [Thermodesulfobacteriota bacterium]